ncbi:lipoprotein [Spiroplasma floricola]|uniref:Lipoprotein n=1 Tax=Spiroplasma floricola 23-6 TaxID=1336749 RepID=A0A2K8SF54_9MOLU|nr:lipoprotein [Spiroplasma floricola]AUB31470.1 hypothetical protein SFLOR_v1c04180 [Spiroplasma floricola 23-6]
MKKLLNLLGAFGLVVSTSTAVIACGTKPTEPGTGSDSDYLKLIEEFKNDLQLLTDNYWKEINSNFFDITNNNESLYTFINQKNITNLVKENGGTLKGDVLSDDNKKYLISDINKILNTKQMEDYYNNNVNKEKYALLIEDINFYTGFEPDWSSLEINYTDDGLTNLRENNSSFMSYINLNLNLKFVYKDSNKQETEYILPKRFIFTLTSNQLLIDSIKNLEKNIANDYYLSGGKYSWIDKEKYNFSNKEDLSKIFSPSNEDLRSIYENDDKGFQIDIINFMKENYFRDINGVPLEFQGNIIFDKFLSQDSVKSNSRKDMSLAKADDLKTYNTIFSKMEKNQKAFLFNQETDINQEMYSYLKDEYLKFYDSYSSRNKNSLATIENNSNKKLSSDKQQAFENSIETGQVKLKGLSLNVSSTYVHPINDLSIFVSFAVSNSETKESRNDYRKSELFGAMYHNLQLGIKTFQEVFDIQARNGNDSNLPIARFSGRGISSSGALDNIWNGIRVSGNQYYTNLNESLNLRSSSLDKHRDVLLETGHQSLYNWTINGSIPVGSSEIKKTTWTYMQVNNSGVIIKGYYYGGDESIFWNFQQNFININFKIDGIWKQRNSVIIEKTNKTTRSNGN